MAFKYHAPTRTRCSVCEQLLISDCRKPIIDTVNGRSSAANGFPFHGWYNFVLGFTPAFPEYVIKKTNINRSNLVVDPFTGSGTTQLVCKLRGIQSIGIDANDFMVYAAKNKLNWDYNVELIREDLPRILNAYQTRITGKNEEFFNDYANENRPEMLDERYFSNKPFSKWHILKSVLKNCVSSKNLELFEFALSSIIVPASNIKYGPGFGIGQQKNDCDIAKLFTDKMNKIISDLSNVSEEQIQTKATVLLGDTRNINKYIEDNSVSLIITSPPYPGDHEYTKHSKLELILNNMATDMDSFRVIKKRMLRASTTNVYRDDNEAVNISDIAAINNVIEEIDKRLQDDGATSGFEKLYTKLVAEYFGGMFSVFKACYRILKTGGTMALLVSDSHAFKMVHISTAELLAEVAKKAGFSDIAIELWQNKYSTSHKYLLRENILLLKK